MEHYPEYQIAAGRQLSPMSTQTCLATALLALLVIMSTAHPVVLSGAFVQPVNLNNPQSDLAKRSLANGRWGLRPGKRSILPEQDYDQASGPESSAQPFYHLFIVA
ncbi:hypothetical protein FO519_000660 [Halicephalobus sp. NKZ332]|nr:hypothetical protein FO519_000660 [Halicephalobus sp. NKZ332]